MRTGVYGAVGPRVIDLPGGGQEPVAIWDYGIPNREWADDIEERIDTAVDWLVDRLKQASMPSRYKSSKSALKGIKTRQNSLGVVSIKSNIVGNPLRLHQT